MPREVSTSLDMTAWVAPLTIIVYFAVQLAVRLWLSPNLEVDDAEMVGQIHWAWGYSNSHPPLYHWLVRLCHDLFGGNWVAATSVPKYALLALGYLLICDAGRQATGCRVTGALAAATLLLIPVIAWKTQGKLTHSILGFTATAATVHATVLIVRRGGWLPFVWLGFAAAGGILAKYNYILVLVALGLACACVREARRAFLRRAALLAPLVMFVLIAPHLLWVRANPGMATQRVYMLQTGGGPLGLDLPASSIPHGLLSFVLVVLVSTVPAALVWTVAAAIAKRRNDGTSTAPQSVTRLIGFLLAGEVAVFIATIVIAGFTQVHERYLVVLLPPVGLWFPLAFSRRSAAFVLGTATVVALFITIARPVSVLRGTGRLMFPYDAVARELQPAAAPTSAIIADRPENAANLAIRVPGMVTFDREASGTRVFVVADKPEAVAALAQQLGPDYQPVSDVRIFAHPFSNRPDRQGTLAVQIWEPAVAKASSATPRDAGSGIHSARLGAAEMKKFVLNLGGFESEALALKDVRKLYHEGAISRHTPCRSRRDGAWSTVDDMFPLLKYEPRSKLCIAGWNGPMRLAASQLLVMPAAGGMPSVVDCATLL